MLHQLWMCLLVKGASPASETLSTPIDSPVGRETRPCAECHAPISRDFAETRMARASLGERIRAEWRKMDFPAYCQDCHAPTMGGGVNVRRLLRYRRSAYAATTHRIKARYAASGRVPPPDREMTVWTDICSARVPLSTTVSKALQLPGFLTG